ncbi:MAG: hypothetical protein ACJAVH_002071, partial [Bacteroidia bacterium]
MPPLTSLLKTLATKRISYATKLYLCIFQLTAMNKDTQVFDLIEQELQRQMHGIELIASENFT